MLAICIAVSIWKFFMLSCWSIEGFPGVTVVKNPSAKQETQIWFLNPEDALQKEMATHSSILAWEISWTEEPGRATVHRVAKQSATK